MAIRRSGSVFETARAITRLTASTLPLYTPGPAVLVYAYRELSPWTVLLFFVPAVAAQRLLVLYQEQRQLVSELATANSRLEASGLSFASALVAALDARDKYTAGHSAAVAVYARDIARRMGLSEADQQLGTPLRPSARHRGGRPPRGNSRRYRPAVPRGTPGYGGAFGDRRPDPVQRCSVR